MSAKRRDPGRHAWSVRRLNLVGAEGGAGVAGGNMRWSQRKGEKAAAAAPNEASPCSTSSGTPLGASEKNSPVVQEAPVTKEDDLSGNDVDGIPDWTSNASVTSDVGSDVGGSDVGSDMLPEGGSDGGSEWDFGDD
eukprot:g16725.t1